MQTLFTITRDVTAEDKLTPQAKTIVDTIVNKVGLNAKLDRDDLVAELEASKALNSRQDVGRVISFYTPRMVESGLLVVEKEGVAEPKAPKEKKAKTPKAAKEPAQATADADAGGSEGAAA